MPLRVGFPEKFELALRYGQEQLELEFHLRDEDRLVLYALAQQAQHGPCREPRPAFWNVREKAMWSAWTALGKRSKMEAMVLYAQAIETHSLKWWHWPALGLSEQASTGDVFSAASCRGTFARSKTAASRTTAVANGATLARSLAEAAALGSVVRDEPPALADVVAEEAAGALQGDVIGVVGAIVGSVSGVEGGVEMAGVVEATAEATTVVHEEGARVLKMHASVAHITHAPRWRVVALAACLWLAWFLATVFFAPGSPSSFGFSLQEVNRRIRESSPVGFVKTL